jgi:catechol 2,3-dioxygenase-like lactoylglutathione lyase family enzyme
MSAAAVTLEELLLADEPEPWGALGFEIADGCMQLGAVRLRFAGSAAGRGIYGWSLRGLVSTELDGLQTTHSEAPLPASPPQHRNGIAGIDHIVAMTPDLDRSVRVLQDAGLDLRRIREQPTPAGAPRQAFFRLGAEILEVVQEPEQLVEQHGEADRPARLWGLALIAPDLQRTVAAMSPHVGEARAAVQPGRRIATLRRSAGLALPVALMSPRT